MFGKNTKKSKKTIRIDTLIGEKTHIEGNLNFSGGLKIDGHVVGKVIAESDSSSVLTLSEYGSIEGEVRSPYLVINGPINGHVFASEHIELAANAKVNGNVYYHVIEMANGAQVNGQLIHIADEDTDILDLAYDVNQEHVSLHHDDKTNLD